MSNFFQPGTTSYRVGLAVSAVALALGTLSQASTGIASINNGAYLMGIVLLLIAVLLGFGTYINTQLLINDWNRVL